MPACPAPFESHWFMRGRAAVAREHKMVTLNYQFSLLIDPRYLDNTPRSSDLERDFRLTCTTMRSIDDKLLCTCADHDEGRRRGARHRGVQGWPEACR